MKIALVTLQGNPFGQTPEAGPDRQDRRLASLVSALAEQDHDVTVYARRDGEAEPEKSEPAPGITVEHVPAGPARQLPSDSLAPHAAEFGHYLARHWQDNAPDVAHAYFWTSGLAALPAPATWASRWCRPSCRCRPAIPPRSGPSSPRPAARRTRRCRRRRRPAPPGAGHCPQRARRAGQFLQRDVHAGQAGRAAGLGPADPARRGHRRRSPPRARWPSGAARPRLLCVAPLAPNQGVDVAVRALADIPEAELVIAGGPEHGKLRGDKAYRALLRLASDLNVRDRVIFHGGVSDAELPALLRSADLLVDAPTGEPFATVALEAMACGTPVVASAIGSHLDTIIDGTTGLLVPPGRPGLIAQRIRTLLASPMLLEGFGIAAVDRARARYSWDRIGQETLAIYERSAAAAA